MRFEQAIDIDAPAERVWAIMIDVERWPEWTASMTSVERLDDGPLKVSSTARVRQPRLRPAVFTVTSYVETSNFVWSSKAPGVTSLGGHQVTANPDGTSTVRLTLDQTGVLAPLTGLLAGRLIRRYVLMEARGLKKHSESHSLE